MPPPNNCRREAWRSADLTSSYPGLSTLHLRLVSDAIVIAFAVFCLVATHHAPPPPRPPPSPPLPILTWLCLFREHAFPPPSPSSPPGCASSESTPFLHHLLHRRGCASSESTPFQQSPPGQSLVIERNGFKFERRQQPVSGPGYGLVEETSATSSRQP